MIPGKFLSIADDVLKTCIKLRGTHNFKKTVNEVVQDVREICDAEVCTILLVDESKADHSIFAMSN